MATTTGIPVLDDLLGGGLEPDALTLLYGPGGTGKTNLCLVAAREVARQGKRVVYVDTEGVSAIRFNQVFAGEPTLEEQVLFMRPLDLKEQDKVIQTVLRMPNVGLVIVDSLNVHYRMAVDLNGDHKSAAQSLFQQLHHLAMYARQKLIPVLCTGQVYSSEDETKPFGNRTMDHMVKAMVQLERVGTDRRMVLRKHRSQPEGLDGWFAITGEGVDRTTAKVPQAPSRSARPEDEGFTTADDLWTP